MEPGSPEPERGNQPEEPDHARRPKPGWAGSGGNGSTGAPASRKVIPAGSFPSNANRPHTAPERTCRELRT